MQRSYPLCAGPKPCSGTKIGKAGPAPTASRHCGELRFGTVVDIMGRTSFQWRHWGCLTKTVLANVKNKIDKAEDIDGFEDLREEDQERVKKAYETGHIAPEDIPESAKAKGEEGDESPADEGRPAKEGHSSPNKRAPAPKAKSKSKKAQAEDEEELEEEKPKKKKTAAPAKKRAKKEATPDEDSEEEAEAVSTDEEEKPKKKKARSSKSKSKSKKGKSDSEASFHLSADSPAPTPRKPSIRRTAHKASMKEEDDDDDE
ncbi:BQ5605_C002g01539 [Microbotryum silenes-dioicae]|uniref:BQ5605_C002g01539 protein n=1 Tax=Microbotryum silenes-dioicae TaxID=796604 RepID=A0A2X0P215_9BASI|nr:BQ5605_C002g01539 [Microbotryum silenes-dioicae]